MKVPMQPLAAAESFALLIDREVAIRRNTYEVDVTLLRMNSAAVSGLSTQRHMHAALVLLRGPCMQLRRRA